MNDKMQSKRSSKGAALENIKRIERISYDRNDLLGTGTYGRVFRGKFIKELEGNSSEIVVAVKRIEKINAIKDLEKVFREIVEPHPNVLQHYCTEEDDDFIYIAIELCAGTLKDIIKGDYKGPPVGSPRQMMRQIARGLQHLHKNRIVHRDIKRCNIVVSIPDHGSNEPPQLKLADFGYCRLVQNESERSLTKCGTRGWMAPELYNSKVSIHEKEAIFAVDIFSLGCVFAYTLSKKNKHPFGPRKLRDYRIENEDMILTIEDFDTYGSCALILIRDMLSKFSPNRISIEEVIYHPFFIEGINGELSESSSNISSDNYYTSLSLNHLKMEEKNHFSSKDSNGRTPLMLLCYKNNNLAPGKQREYMEQFLDLPQVDEKVVNDKDCNGNTALSLLCEHYNDDDLIDIIRLFIKKGVNVNEVIPNKNGFNALMLLCIQYNHDNLIDIIKLFINHDIDLDARSSDDGWNVLHILCRYYNSDKLIEIISPLIENGIDLNAVTIKENWNTITFLCLYYSGRNMLNILRLLIDNGININVKASNGLNALGWVCYLYYHSDLIDIIGMLIEKDSSVVNCINEKTGANPLLLVCSQEYIKKGPDNLIDIILLLVNSGIDANSKTLEGWNCLMFLCRFYRHSNLIDIVKLLVKDNRIEINCETKYGSNAFLLLCTNENVHHTICFDVIQLFIYLEANVNAVYQIDSNNALTMLCKYHHNCYKLLDIIRLILSHSSCTINVNHENQKGENVMSILKSMGGLLRIKDWEEINKYLKSRQQ